MKRAVFCIARNRQQAEQIIERLLGEGFEPEDVSILLSDVETTSRRGGQMFESTTTEDWTTTAKGGRLKGGGLGHEKKSKMPEGAATGAAAGGIIGGTLGLLAGIGALAIPGFGPFIAAGPIMAALSGSALGGSLGLIVGALTGLGIPEYEAVRYQQQLKQGNVLISVHTDTREEVDQAKRLLEQLGAEHISCTTEVASTGNKKRSDR